MPYRLIEAPISKDTVQACRELLDAAEDGHVIGLAVVVLLRKRQFLVDCCGEAARDPVLTRGALLSLDDCLRSMTLNRAEHDQQ